MSEQLVICDIDSTLLRCVHADEVFASVYRRTSGCHLETALDTAAQAELVILEQIRARCGSDTAVTLSELTQVYHQELRASYETKPPIALAGAREVLQTLVSEGVHVIFATGNSRAVARLKLEFSGLAALGQWNIALRGGFGDELICKTKIVAAALDEWQKTGGGPCSATIVGDSPKDMVAGRAHGLRCVGVCTGAWTRDALLAAGAHSVLYDFSDMEGSVAEVLGRPVQKDACTTRSGLGTS